MQCFRLPRPSRPNSRDQINQHGEGNLQALNDTSLIDDSINNDAEQDEQHMDENASTSKQSPHDTTNESDTELEHYCHELEQRIIASTPTSQDIAATQPLTEETETRMERNVEHGRETTTEPGTSPKRPLSSDSSDETKLYKKRDVKDALENACFCGESLLQPNKIGNRLQCGCERYHIRCICNKVFVSKEHGAAHCTACKRDCQALINDLNLS